MRLPIIVPAAALLAALALPAGAQQATPATPARSGALPIIPGARVRISATTIVAPLVANFLEMRGDTAVFLEAGAGRGIWNFPVDQITKLELSRGDERYQSRAMLKGAAIGAPIGAFVFWGTTGILKPSDSSQQYDRGTTAAAGLLVGAAIGAFVGSRAAQEGWMTLPLPNRVSFAPYVPLRRDGMGLQVGLRF